MPVMHAPPPLMGRRAPGRDHARLICQLHTQMTIVPTPNPGHYTPKLAIAHNESWRILLTWNEQFEVHARISGVIKAPNSAPYPQFVGILHNGGCVDQIGSGCVDSPVFAHTQLCGIPPKTTTWYTPKNNYAGPCRHPHIDVHCTVGRLYYWAGDTPDFAAPGPPKSYGITPIKIGNTSPGSI